MVNYETCSVDLNTFKHYISINIKINICRINLLLIDNLKKDFYIFATSVINKKSCSFVKKIDNICYIKIVYDYKNLLHVFTEFINMIFEINDQIINIFKDITNYYEINNIV